MPPPDAAFPALPSSPSSIPLPGRGLRVLVADDNPVNREMALQMLAQIGCQADAAADGLEALQAHRTTRYDLILMDCDMPTLDGYAATMQLREEEGARRTPVLALTAHSGPEQEALCKQAGMDAMLTKPLRPQSLREALANWAPGTDAAAPEKAAPTVPAKTAEPAAAADELEAVSAMFGSDFAELAALYRNDGPPRLANLRTALQTTDHVLLAKVAHALGGSSASIGASGLADMCRELELLAKAGLTDECAVRLARIEHEYRRVSDKLQALLAR